jgi:hypothetical protein
MNISSETESRDGRPIKVTLKWSVNGENKNLVFKYDISYRFSDKIGMLFVEVYELNLIQVYDSQAILQNEYEIPKLEGYQYRGLNINKNSKTGISLLYFPVHKNVGNEWKDIEQYEFIDNESIIGKKLGLYR